MSNTIKTSNRTIEISAIDEDYVMDPGLIVEQVVFVLQTIQVRVV